MANCKEIARLLASDGLADAALTQQARVRLHLLFCRHCRGYAVQLKAVGTAGREIWGSCTAEHGTLERLEQSILDHALNENREKHP